MSTEFSLISVTKEDLVKILNDYIYLKALNITRANPNAFDNGNAEINVVKAKALIEALEEPIEIDISID